MENTPDWPPKAEDYPPRVMLPLKGDVFYLSLEEAWKLYLQLKRLFNQ